MFDSLSTETQIIISVIGIALLFLLVTANNRRNKKKTSNRRRRSFREDYHKRKEGKE